jgi:hypothetical protein
MSWRRRKKLKRELNKEIQDDYKDLYSISFYNGFDIEAVLARALVSASLLPFAAKAGAYPSTRATLG